ncbi:MAG: NosD domain-containing protein [Nanopusillaceae archaeon]
MNHYVLIILVFLSSLLSSISFSSVHVAHDHDGSIYNYVFPRYFVDRVSGAKHYLLSDDDEYVNYSIVCEFINESGYYVLDSDYVFEFGEDSICIYINSSHVILDGRNHLIMNTGDERTGRYAVVVEEGVENVTIMNLRIVNFAWGITLLGSNENIEIINVSITESFSGIEFVFARDVRILNSRFTYIDYDCIAFAGVEKLVIAGNSFTYCDTTGILTASSLRSRDIEVYNNSFVMRRLTFWFGGVEFDAIIHAVSIWHASNIKIHSNYVKNGAGFFLRDNDNLEIYNNTLEVYIYQRWGLSVDVWDSRNVRIYGNRLLYKTGGIAIWNSTNVEIYENIVRDSSIGVVLFRYSSNIYIYNNVFENNGGGITLYTSVSNIYIYNNLFLSKEMNIEVRRAVDEDVDVPRNVYLNTTLKRGENILGGVWIGGNAWLYPNNTGFSQTCRDDEEPIGICDEPFIYRVNQTVLIDYLPLSLKKYVETTTTSETNATTTDTYSPVTTTTVSEYVSETEPENYVATETPSETRYETRETETGSKLPVLFNITIAIIVVTVIITIVIGTYMKLTRTK